MSDCEHKWRLMRVPYECPYCLRERAERAETDASMLRALLDRMRYNGVRNERLGDWHAAIDAVLHEGTDGL